MENTHSGTYAGREEVKLWGSVQKGAGVSRRKAQDLIRAGEVDIGGTVITDPFAEMEVTPGQPLYLRGQPLPLSPRKSRVYLYYKPRGVLCSHDDPHTGNTLGRILRNEGFIGYTWAGRLDHDAEGLVLLANDGALVARLTHPRYRVKKIYHVWTNPPGSSARMRKIFTHMRAGIDNHGETLHIVRGVMTGRPARAVITLAKGRKHEVKRLFAHFGLEVVRLKRVAIGPVQLSPADQPGKIARLDRDDVRHLYAAVGLNPPTGL